VMASSSLRSRIRPSWRRAHPRRRNEANRRTPDVTCACVWMFLLFFILFCFDLVVDLKGKNKQKHTVFFNDKSTNDVNLNIISTK
jgi:hypothetical protein